MHYGIILCYNNHNVLILFSHVYLITPDGYTDSKLLSMLAIYYVCVAISFVLIYLCYQFYLMGIKVRTS